MTRTIRFLFPFLCLAAATFCGNLTAIAQPNDTPSTGAKSQLLDGVAAVVGNEVILISDVYQQALLFAQQQKGIDPRDPKVHQEVLNAIIDEKLVLTKAKEDSVTVSEDEVTSAVNRQIDRLVDQLGSIKRLEEAYGMPIDRIRQEARELIRQQLLAERIRQRHFADVKLTEHDLQEFYQQYADSIPQVPEQVELQRIVLKSKPSASAKGATIALARSIIDSIKGGGDFADFARRYSADPGSASSGGDLGFVGTGKFIKEYEDAMKKLGINEISGPVETQYGIHIIQVLDRRADATRSRHILLRIEQSGAERDSLVATLNEIRSRALAGESFDSLAARYSEDEETRGLGGSLGKLPVEQLPSDLKPIVAGLKEGEISQPQPTTLSPTESGYQIIRLVRHIAPHRLDPAEDRPQLEQLATYYKRKTDYAKWVEELRNEIYWEIKNDNMQ
jgi:peptidyl-prolyl cis-trans isomerase SurA